jgi:mannonate dehydratase
MKFLYSWRWFGPNDRIRLAEIRQAGASGIVTALHQIPVGEVWSVEAVLERKKMVEAAGLQWVVVESLPVSEDIKKQSGDCVRHIENYKTSIRNLAACGITTICYNFMPILDWSRTSLRVTLDDGSYTSGFQRHIFAAFDLFILKRSGAEQDYPPEVIEAAKTFFQGLEKEQKQTLKETILYGLPGSMQTYTPEEFQRLLDSYSGVDRAGLKRHLSAFLNEVVPVAEACGVKLAIHPDDPPWNLLGLPRIVSTVEDLQDITGMIDSPSNGITLCTGSLGAGHFNDLPRIVEAVAPSIHFVHLRNVVRDAGLNFQEETFFDGDIDMAAVVKALLQEGRRREAAGEPEWILPVRPDHGHQILDDVGRENYPGYGLYGRMKNLAEIKGLVTGLSRCL